MKRSWLTYGIVAVILLVLAGLLWTAWHMRQAKLPYRDSFAERHVQEWSPYGGSWKLEDGAIAVSSIERGAKVVTGSASWTDYQVTADIQLQGHDGDMGIAVRVNDPRIGIDAYKGYFAGLRVDDSSIVLGRSERHWLSVPSVHMQGGVHTQTWYRLHVVVVDCRIAVEATNLTNGAENFAGLQDKAPQCIQAGQLALRTTDAAGAWKHVSVTRATASDMAAMAQHVPSFDVPQYPIREREFNAMREQYLDHIPKADISSLVSGAGGADTTGIPEDAPLVQVNSLRSYVWNGKPIRIVGVITSTEPFYLQDSTGGIRLEASQNISFQVGDEVEVLGRPTINADSTRFLPMEARVLWDRAPVVALSVTATQAASGRYEGSLVELSGTVRHRAKLSNGNIELLLQEGSQHFSVQVKSDIFTATALQIESGSRVRVRGICSSINALLADKGAFVLYASSPADVVLLAGPPWWTGQRLIFLLCVVLALVVLVVYFFIATERSKIRVVHEERERLSHDMHDTLAQSLAGVGFKLQGIRRSMRESHGIPPEILEEVDATCEMVVGTHREASANIAALHPASQKDGDLLTLLERSVFSMLDGDGIDVAIVREGDPRTMSPVVADTLFRVGREAIANVLRHSRATEIKVSIVFRNRDLTLAIADNGMGFMYDPEKRGFGLQSMERRCKDINAKVDVVTAPGEGCTIRITSPYHAHPVLFRWIG